MANDGERHFFKEHVEFGCPVLRLAPSGPSTSAASTASWSRRSELGVPMKITSWERISWKELNIMINVGTVINQPWLGMVNIPTISGDFGDGLFLLYPHCIFIIIIRVLWHWSILICHCYNTVFRVIILLIGRLVSRGSMPHASREDCFEEPLFDAWNAGSSEAYSPLGGGSASNAARASEGELDGTRQGHKATRPAGKPTCIDFSSCWRQGFPVGLWIFSPIHWTYENIWATTMASQPTKSASKARIWTQKLDAWLGAFEIDPFVRLLLRHPSVQKVSEETGKTTAQVLLRWALQQEGCTVR